MTESASLLIFFRIGRDRNGDLVVRSGHAALDQIAGLRGELNDQLRGVLGRLADEGLARDEQLALVIQAGNADHLVVSVQKELNLGVDLNRHAGRGLSS